MIEKKTFIISTLTFTLSVITLAVSAEETHSKSESEKFNATEMIVHHISDSYEWHFATVRDHHYSIPLPVILYSTTKGLQIFSSAVFHHNDTYNGYKLEHNHIKSIDPVETIYDLSITKNVASMMLSAVLLIIVFGSVTSGFTKNRGKAPSGIQSVFEPLIIFVRDEIAKPNIGERYAFYLPFLLTIFFFIWINNLLGLLPQGANVTGNIAFTMTMAIFTLIVTNISGKKSYWGHIFAPPVPWLLRIIMIPVEIIGIFTKPFALMVRLFANITAGHIIILSILSFIFIFQKVFVAAISVPFAIIMSVMEFGVAALQAYIFTLLTALFIGQAVAEHEHHDDHH